MLRMTCRRQALALLALCLTLPIATAPPLHAGANSWTPLGLSGGSVDQLAAAPSRQGVVYARLSDRIYRTVDAGLRWQGGAPIPYASVLVVDPQQADTVYLFSGSGLEKSLDGGLNLAPTALTAPTFALAIAPSAPATLYAVKEFGTASYRAVKSADGGATWQDLEIQIAGYPPLNPLSLTVDPRNADSVYAAGYFDGPVTGNQSAVAALHSADGGASWALVPGLHAEPTEIFVDPTDSTVLYAAGQGVFRSLNGGASWTDISPSPEFQGDRLFVDPKSPSTLYANGRLGNGWTVWKSTDRGTSWNALPDLSSRSGAFALDGKNSHRLYFASDTWAVTRSDDGGTSALVAGYGLNGSSNAAIAVDPARPTQLVAAGARGAVISGDSGARWEAVDRGLVVTLPVYGTGLTFTGPVTISRFLAGTQPGSFFAATQDGVFETTDDGADWSRSSPSGLLGSVVDLAADPAHPGTLYAAAALVSGDAAAQCGIGVTHDGGAHWTTLHCVTPGNAIAAVAVHPQSSRVYAVSVSPLTVLASDGGAPLAPLAGTGLPAAGFSVRARIAVDPTSPADLYLTTDALPLGVYRSTDGGAHWTDATNGLPAGALVEDLLVDPVVPGTFYVATSSGVFVSADRGGSWSALGGLGHPALSLAISPEGRTLYATTGRSYAFATDSAGLFAFTRGACLDTATSLCLQHERFAVRVHWSLPDGTSGFGQPLAVGTGGTASANGPDTAAFSFFTPGNQDLVVKVLDGSTVNAHFWVFYGALSNVQYTITVTDTATGAIKTYRNPRGQQASHADTSAFPSTPVPPAAPAPSRAVSAVGAAAAATPALTGPATPAPAPSATADANVCDPTVALCLGPEGRYRVEAAYHAPFGASGPAAPLAFTQESGGFWFFDSGNVEVVVKVLDGTAVNGHVWVFYGALSNVAYSILVTDRETGRQRFYTNPQGRMASVADVEAF